MIEDPAALGEAKAADGRLGLLNDQTGHYTPSTEDHGSADHLRQLVDEFHSNGIRGFQIHAYDVSVDAGTARFNACSEQARAYMQAVAVQGERFDMSATLASVGLSRPDELQPLIHELMAAGFMDDRGPTWLGTVIVSNQLHGDGFDLLDERLERLRSLAPVLNELSRESRNFLRAGSGEGMLFDPSKAAAILRPYEGNARKRMTWSRQQVELLEAAGAVERVGDSFLHVRLTQEDLGPASRVGMTRSQIRVRSLRRGQGGSDR